MPVLDELARSFPGVAIDLTFDVELWGAGHAAWRDGALVDYGEDTPY